MRLDEIPALDEQGAIHVVIESPRGCRVKLKYEPRFDRMMLSRPLPAGLVYPHDWGFVPGTCASDGDPIDALVVSDTATAPGIVVVCRPLGVLEIEQDAKTGGRERNDRIIATPKSAHRWANIADVFALSERTRDEIAAFFVQATLFERKNVKVLGWAGPDRSVSLVRDSLTRPSAQEAAER
jgi:inorganic pyrophosphatase